MNAAGCTPIALQRRHSQHMTQDYPGIDRGPQWSASPKHQSAGTSWTACISKTGLMDTSEERSMSLLCLGSQKGTQAAANMFCSLRYGIHQQADSTR